ncbi:MAG: DUF1569 domain-containing protein [Planctomycetes bacterium]|nr:DUF1569 domain-containing protein [Planctomycetota bacterium]
MPSLFQSADLAAIQKRLQSLRPDSKAQWGKMDVAQMLAHSQVALKIAVGDMTLKRGLIGLLFGRLAKKKLTSPAPFGRNLPTALEFRVSDARVFAAEQAQLLELVQRFGTRGPAGAPKAPHPFFGPLTAAEWDTLQWKHLDHHLRQFGA